MRRASETRACAMQSLNNNWGNAILGYLLYAVIVSGVAYLCMIVPVAIFFLVPPLVFGYIYFALKLVRGKTAQINDLFRYFNADYWLSVGAYLLKMVLVFLWSLLFFIPGIIKAYSYAMTDYLIVNKIETGANAAITRSRQLMYGNKWRLFCLHFSFIGWHLLAVLTCGILYYVWLGPYMMAADMVFFEEVATKAGFKPDVVQPATADGNVAGQPTAAGEELSQPTVAGSQPVEAKSQPVAIEEPAYDKPDTQGKEAAKKTKKSKKSE